MPQSSLWQQGTSRLCNLNDLLKKLWLNLVYALIGSLSSKSIRFIYSESESGFRISCGFGYEIDASGNGSGLDSSVFS